MSGKWYIVHVISGSEKKIAQAITEKAMKTGLQDRVMQIVVPKEDVVEIRRGKKVSTERKFLPGYIMIQMVMDEDTWHLVRGIPKVTGFLGSGTKPSPVPQAQVDVILKQMTEGVVTKEETIRFEIGEAVKIIDGPFESFVGNVEEVDSDKSRLKVSVSIFGRSTPVDLEFNQVSKEL